MSLPHFRAQTSFGFTTLSQSPHTRRKESLFHTGNEPLLPYRRANSVDTLKTRLLASGLDEINEPFGLKDPYDSIRGIPKGPSVIVTPSVSPSHTENQIKTHSSSMLGSKYYNVVCTNGGMCHLTPKTRYYRRRSSLVGLNNNANLSDDSSHNSLEGSPEGKRKSMTSLYPGKHERALSPNKRHSSPQLNELKTNVSESLKNGTKPPDLQYCHYLVQHGELKFSFQYLARSRHLKVTLIRSENLGGEGKVDGNINAYAKLYLLPGKLQKQTSETIKHTRKPVFEQEFYFQSLSLEQLHAMTLRIKIFHKGHNLRLPEFIGKVDVNLDNYDLLTENRMWKDLDIKRDREVSI